MNVVLGAWSIERAEVNVHPQDPEFLLVNGPVATGGKVGFCGSKNLEQELPFCQPSHFGASGLLKQANDSSPGSNHHQSEGPKRKRGSYLRLVLHGVEPSWLSVTSKAWVLGW